MNCRRLTHTEWYHDESVNQSSENSPQQPLKKMTNEATFQSAAWEPSHETVWWKRLTHSHFTSHSSVVEKHIRLVVWALCSFLPHYSFITDFSKVYWWICVRYTNKFNGKMVNRLCLLTYLLAFLKVKVLLYVITFTLSQQIYTQTANSRSCLVPFVLISNMEIPLTHSAESLS